MVSKESAATKYSILVPTYQEHDNIKPFIALIMKEAKEQY